MYRALICGLCIGLMLAGCGGDRFPVKIQPEIHADGTTVLRRGNGAEPESLDPHQARSVPAANILRDLYEGLVSRAPDGTLEPGGAVSWDISDDRLTYTFKLRENARWSNGAPVTSGDYVYSLRRAVTPSTGSVYAQMLSPIVNASAIIAGKKPPATLGVRALDKHTLEIRLESVTPYFLGILTHSISYPVYRPAVEKYGDRHTQPQHSVTNGAYQLVSWRVNSMIALERNPYYWDNADTDIDRVEYYPLTDDSSALARYQAGALDWIASLPIPRLDAIRRHIPEQLHTHPSLGVYYYGFNLTRPPFEDAPKLRQALSMAIDRDIIVDKITRGGEVAAYSWVPPAVRGYKNARFEWAGLSDEQRQARARELYRRAGYSLDNPLHVELRYNTSDSHRKLASVIAAMWRKVLGVEVTMINEEWKVFLQNVQQGDTQVYRAGWIADYNDPNTFLELMNSKFGLNGTGYHSARYDALQSRSAHMPPGAARQRVMRQAEAVLLADHPVMPVYFYASKNLIKPYVEGFVGNAMSIHYSKDLSIEPAGA